MPLALMPLTVVYMAMALVADPSIAEKAARRVAPGHAVHEIAPQNPVRQAK